MLSVRKLVKFKNNCKKVNEIIKNYTFLHVLSQSDFTNNRDIFSNFKKSNFIMINEYARQSEHQKQDNCKNLVRGFKKTIIIIEKSSFEILQPLLSSKRNINIYFLTEINDITNFFNNKSQIIYHKDKIFNAEINNFNSELFLNDSSDSEFKSNWKYIAPCISGYLIKESYEKTKIDRLDKFINFEKANESTTENSTLIPIINENEFLKLRSIGIGNKIELIYHIEKEEIFILKKHNDGDDDENEKLTKREIENYTKVQHPFMPKLIGIGENYEYLIIEFINGQSLSDINKVQFTYSEKITIFFEIIIIIEFLHRKQFIYRDLKPNNIMIDKNKTAVLIDFDRMIEYENSFNTTTKNFSSSYCAPEVNYSDFSYECDIYSLANSFLYLINQDLDEFMKSDEFQEIKQIISESLNNKPRKRPSILKMIFIFYYCLYYYIQIHHLFEIYIIKIF